MNEERRRQAAALGAALGIHIAAAALGGWILLSHEEKLPPGVVEVAVIGDAGSAGAAAPGKADDAAGAEGSMQKIMQKAVSSMTEETVSHAPTASRMETVEGPQPARQQPKMTGTSSASASSGRAVSAAPASGNHKGNGGHGETGSGREGQGTGNGSGHGALSEGMGSNFRKNGDGSYTAMSSAGISYKILRDARAVYPDEAKDIGYTRQVAVTADILVGLSGKVESVSIITSAPPLGFKEEAIRACRQMKFAPIYYNGKNIKMHFRKTIHFIP